jgi:hypothetical protein
MCYNCGCGITDDDMGSVDNITDTTFASLAKNWNKSADETKKQVYQILEKQLNGETVEEDDHMKSMFIKASEAWGQPEKEARKNTYDLLKSEMK